MTEKKERLIRQIYDALKSGKKNAHWGGICIKKSEFTPNALNVFVNGWYLGTYSELASGLSSLSISGEKYELKHITELTDDAIEYINQAIKRLKRKDSDRILGYKAIRKQQQRAELKREKTYCIYFY